MRLYKKHGLIFPFHSTFRIYTLKYQMMESIKVYQRFFHFRPIFAAMKSTVWICQLFLFLFSMPAMPQALQIAVPYTLADRDRAILTESKINIMEARLTSVEARLTAVETRLTTIETRMEAKFDSQQRQLDDLKTLFFWGFGILITLFLFMFGYMIWDRRTAMKPALERASKAMDDNRHFLTVLRDYSKNHPDLADILRTHGML